MQVASMCRKIIILGLFSINVVHLGNCFSYF